MSDIKFNCPQCGTRLQVDASAAGLTVSCPNCSNVIAIPSASSAPPAKPVVSPVRPQPMKSTPARTKWFVLATVAAVAVLATLAAVWFLLPRKPSATSAKPDAEARRGEKQTTWFAGSLDTSFNVGTGVEGRHGQVYAMAAQSDGKLVIAGMFSSVNEVVRQNIARLNSNGSLDSSFKTEITLDEEPYARVICVVPQTDGKIVLAGGFGAVNGSHRHRIARIETDGSLDSGFQPNFGANGRIACVAIQRDGKIVVGGGFTNAFDQATTGLVRLHGDGTLDLEFRVDWGTNAVVRSIVVQADNRLLIAGSFWKANRPESSLFTRLNSDGSTDASFKVPAVQSQFPLSAVSRIGLQPDGKILIGGSFTNINDRTRKIVARLNADGSLDESFDIGESFTGMADCLCVHPDGRIYLGGMKSYGRGVGITRLQKNGELDADFVRSVGQLGGRGWDSSPRIFCLAVAHDGKVMIGGDFDSVSGTARKGVARLKVDGTLDQSFNPGSGVQGGGPADTKAVAVQPDRKVLIVGNFWKVDGVARNGIARLGVDGRVDPTFDPGSGAEGGFVGSLAVLPNGKILAGGNFKAFCNQPRPHLVRLNPDASLDASFNAEPGLKEVGGVVLQADGKILIEGGFEGKNGVKRNRILRLNSNGSLDPSFDAGPGPDSSLWPPMLQADGKILTIGWFKNVSGVPRAHVARLNSDGSLDTTFNPGSGLNTAAFASALQSDGKIVVGGGFTNVAGRACQRIARLNPDGSLDSGFNLNSGMDQWVHRVVIQADRKMLVGGWFENVAGVPRGHIARLNPDGTLDTSFDPGAGADSLVNSIVIDKNGDIMVGGPFKTFDKRPRAGIARLHGDSRTR